MANPDTDGHRRDGRRDDLPHFRVEVGKVDLVPITEPVLLQGDLGYRIEVPANSASLTIDLASDPSTVDLDLHARYGAEPNVVNNRIVADYTSSGDSGVERIVIDALSVPPLRAGTYFVSISAWTTGIPIKGTLRAAVAANRSSASDELGKSVAPVAPGGLGVNVTVLRDGKQPAFAKSVAVDEDPLMKQRKLSVRSAQQ